MDFPFIIYRLTGYNVEIANAKKITVFDDVIEVESDDRTYIFNRDKILGYSIPISHGNKLSRIYENHFN